MGEGRIVEIMAADKNQDGQVSFKAELMMMSKKIEDKRQRLQIAEEKLVEIKNDDGKLSFKDELKRMSGKIETKRTRLQKAEEKLGKIMNADKNKDGKVSFEEYLGWFK